MSQSLWNVVHHLDFVLPPEPGSQLRSKFSDRLDELPIGYDDSWDGPWSHGHFSDDDNRPDHLATASGWFSITMLVDPRLGVLPFAETENERVAVYRTADVILRALDGQIDEYDDGDEWEIAASTDDLGDDGEWTIIRTAAMSAAWMRLSMGGNVEPLLDGAAGLWSGHSFPRRDRAYFWPEGLGSRIGNGIADGLVDSILWLFRRLPKNRGHYYSQARWLLQLMDISWKPEDDAERSILHKLLSGDLAELPAYLDMLKPQWVEPEVIDQLPATFRRAEGTAADRPQQRSEEVPGNRRAMGHSRS